MSFETYNDPYSFNNPNYVDPFATLQPVYTATYVQQPVVPPPYSSFSNPLDTAVPVYNPTYVQPQQGFTFTATQIQPDELPQNQQKIMQTQNSDVEISDEESYNAEDNSLWAKVSAVFIFVAFLVGAIALAIILA